MTPYEQQTEAIKQAREALEAAAEAAEGRDDSQDVRLFHSAAEALRSAFNLS